MCFLLGTHFTKPQTVQRHPRYQRRRLDEILGQMGFFVMGKRWSMACSKTRTHLYEIDITKNLQSTPGIHGLEIIDARLYQYQQRKPLFQNLKDSCLISSRLALRLPRVALFLYSNGPITCRLPTGDIWIFKLSKVALCRTPLGSQNNQFVPCSQNGLGASISRILDSFFIGGGSRWVEPLGGLLHLS